jgi:hypothetical protein
LALLSFVDGTARLFVAVGGAFGFEHGFVDLGALVGFVLLDHSRVPAIEVDQHSSHGSDYGNAVPRPPRNRPEEPEGAQDTHDHTVKPTQ